MKRYLSIVGLAGALAAASSVAMAQDPTKVTMLTDFLFSGTHTPYFAGLAQHKFEDVNIDLTIQPGKSSTDGANQLAAGAVQFAVLDPVPVLLAVSKGAKLSIVAAYLQKNPNGFCYLKDKYPNFKFDDLASVKIGGVNGDSIVITLQALMPGKTLNVVTMAGASQSAALISEQVDAISCSVGSFPTRAAAAKEAGHEMGIVALADDGGLKSVGQALVVPTALAEKDPDLVQRIVEGFAESVAWSAKNPEGAVDALVKANPELNPELTLKTWKAFTPFLSIPGKPWFKLDPEATKATADIANKAYGITTITDAAFDNRFVEKLSPDLLAGKP